jgi:hypothetical protein
MKMKQWLDRQVHEACVQLRSQWPELLLKLLGGYALLCGLAQPFITVVPHGTPEQIRREMLFATVGFSVAGIALLTIGNWLTRKRKRGMTNQQVQPIAGKPGSG